MIESLDWKKRPHRTRFLILISVLVFLCLTIYRIANGSEPGSQKTFSTPKAAAKALLEAAKAKDMQEILTIFGPEVKDLLISEDEQTTADALERFADAASQKMKLVKAGRGKTILEVGKNRWPFPFPIVRKGKAWHFDVGAGKEEIISRRIGRNELFTIAVCLAYVDVQREYAAKDRDGDGILEYAQRFVSQQGQQDGLFWEAGDTGEESPIGRLLARAHKPVPAMGDSSASQSPFHGYYYKILTEQGSNAPGGARSYVINGNMTDGFALLAYPAYYGLSGIKTFQVNQQGIVFEKDLRKDTAAVVENISVYDPDATWQPVE